MGGGAPPAPSGNEIDMKIQQAVQSALQTAGGGAGGAPGAGAGAGMKPPKPDINVVATDVFQLKKMLLALIRQNGMELPPDILDGPNRDPVTGNPSMAPTGGSDPAAGAAQGGAGGGIPPIGGLPPMGQPKTASDNSSRAALVKAAADVLSLYAILLERDAAALDVWNGELDKAATAVDTAESPGKPFGRREVDPLQSMMGKAAALARRFKVRGAHAK